MGYSPSLQQLLFFEAWPVFADLPGHDPELTRTVANALIDLGCSLSGIPVVSSLAYIGTDSSMAQQDEHDHRSSRFRLGNKEE